MLVRQIELKTQMFGLLIQALLHNDRLLLIILNMSIVADSEGKSESAFLVWYSSSPAPSIKLLSKITLAIFKSVNDFNAIS